MSLTDDWATLLDSGRHAAANEWLVMHSDTPLRRLLTKLRCYVVERWAGDSDDVQTVNRVEEEMDKADVFSSLLKDSDAAHPRHYLVLDLDIPAHLIPSSTPGHSHLIVEVPGGIPHDRYMALLDRLANAKVIEPGYAAASRERGHSDLRLPWVKKDDLPAPPQVEIVREDDPF